MMFFFMIFVFESYELSIITNSAGEKRGEGKRERRGDIKERRREGRVGQSEGKGKDCFSRDGIVRGGMNHK